MKIYLVRHGRTIANKDKTCLLEIADHKTPLAEEGIEQAHEVGQFLKEEIEESWIKNPSSWRMWTSPYERARHTTKIIHSEFEPLMQRTIDIKEHINLCEQQFGLFDGYLDEELPTKFPMEHAYYMKSVDQNGIFWARTPQGESRFDVALRVHESFGTFHRDAERHGKKNIIIVCHGVVVRAFVMRWLHLTPEWFNEEKNPKNCSVRLIENGLDKGYIFIP